MNIWDLARTEKDEVSNFQEKDFLGKNATWDQNHKINLLESKYNNKFIIKEDSDLSEFEPFNKQDYINIINYETQSFSRRKKNWEKSDEIDQFHKVNEPQVCLLKNIIKNEQENNNNDISSGEDISRSYKPKYEGSVSNDNYNNQEYALLSQQLAKKNYLSLDQTATRNVKEFKNHEIKPTPFKIWIEEYNNNVKKNYVSYIDVAEKVTYPFLRIDDIEPALKSSTPSYKEQTTRLNLFYLEPLLKIPISDDGKRIIMAKRNFPSFPVIKWKFRKEKIDTPEPEKTTKHKKNDNKTTGEMTNITPLNHTTTTIKSVMDKLNEINLDVECPEFTVKTTTRRSKEYSEKFCGTETETPFTDTTTLNHCKNYSGIIHCPNCRKKIRYNLEVIRKIQQQTTNPTTPKHHKHTL